MHKKRVHIIYSGHVQGVGFRFTVERTALRCRVNGFVRNLPDGTVETVCEGEKDSLDVFISDMNDAMKGYISDSRINWSDCAGEFSAFQILF